MELLSSKLAWEKRRLERAFREAGDAIFVGQEIVEYDGNCESD